MDKKQLKKFREHYFPAQTYPESRVLLCLHFKSYGLTERQVMAWEYGQNLIQPWFEKVAKDFDTDNILEK